MGWLINFLRKNIESIAKNNTFKLKVGGFFITLTLIIISGLVGYTIEQLTFSEVIILKYIGLITIIITLASTIAYKSLFNSVIDILESLTENYSHENLESARIKLRQIVGRNVDNLDKQEILRATAESASENSVDGVFAPIFWIVIGIILWKYSTSFPGPLALALIFKASSTLDSMLGYKEGKLLWLGYASAKLDDLLTWIPCRIVVMTLPLVTKNWSSTPMIIKKAWIDGSKDESPNSGLSEAIFAHCFQIRMGGLNKYSQGIKEKSILAKHAPEATNTSIKEILKKIFHLQLLWIIIILLINNLLKIYST